MTLAELIASFRSQAGDTVAPYFWSDAVVTGFINEGLVEGAIRARLIHEADDADVCQIAVTAGTAKYALSASLYELTYHAFLASGETRRTPVSQVSVDFLNWYRADWREWEAGTPQYLIQDDLSVRLVPTPSVDGTLYLEGYRLPATLTATTDTPEINAAHHRHLVDWALHRAYGMPDADRFDASKSGEAEERFTSYFGFPVSSDLRRSTRDDVPQHVRAFMP